MTRFEKQGGCSSKGLAQILSIPSTRPMPQLAGSRAPLPAKNRMKEKEGRAPCLNVQLLFRSIMDMLAHWRAAKAGFTHSMNRPTTVVVLIAVLFSLLTACSRKDKVVNIEPDDPEMLAAIDRARETLPQFWQAFDQKKSGESDFALKVKITDKNGTEHFWANDIERQGGKTMGTINNDPNIVGSVKLGDRIQIPEADISDWLYMRDGKMVGNETLKPLLKKLPAAEAEKLKKMMASP
jgi:uncharacterized protein YegJ (DUF2314 family)